MSTGSTALSVKFRDALRAGQGGMLEVDQLQKQAERLVEGERHYARADGKSN